MLWLAIHLKRKKVLTNLVFECNFSLLVWVFEEDYQIDMNRISPVNMESAGDSILCWFTPPFDCFDILIFQNIWILMPALGTPIIYSPGQKLITFYYCIYFWELLLSLNIQIYLLWVHTASLWHETWFVADEIRSVLDLGIWSMNEEFLFTACFSADIKCCLSKGVSIIDYCFTIYSQVLSYNRDNSIYISTHNKSKADNYWVTLICTALYR